MNKSVTWVVSVLGVFGAGALGIVSGLGLVSGAYAGEPATPTPSYSVNSDGRTIGPWIGGKDAFQPDLVEIRADNGRNGFAWTTDLKGEVAKSPEDAARIMKERVNSDGDIVIPVYEDDGTTQIGVATIGHVEESVETTE